MSLIARPSVLFLDEPTTGLDPRSRLAVWDLIEELGRGGTTTLLTTQYLDEADRLADEVVVIDHGRVIATGTPQVLKQQVGGDRIEITFADPCDADRVVEALREQACGEVLVLDERPQSDRARRSRSKGMVPEAVRRLDRPSIPLRRRRRPRVHARRRVLRPHRPRRQENGRRVRARARAREGGVMTTTDVHAGPRDPFELTPAPQTDIPTVRSGCSRTAGRRRPATSRPFRATPNC